MTCTNSKKDEGKARKLKIERFCLFNFGFVEKNNSKKVIY